MRRYDDVPDADLRLEHLVTSIPILLAFPILTAALMALLADRNMGAVVYSDEMGGPMLWQHLFWFFGHPEVYIIALPFFGIVTEIIPVFSRKPLFGYKGMVGATMMIGFLSLAVWGTTCTPPAPSYRRSSPS